VFGFDPDQGPKHQPGQHFSRSSKEDIDMPFDAVLLSFAVTVVFVGFAVALAWADLKTRPPQAHGPAPRRRSF